MTKKVFSLNTLAGVQRDGTVFDKNFYTSAKWTRFQRGRPRKILGYRTLSEQLSGPSRGIWVNSSNGLNQIFSGYSSGLQELTIDSLGNGQGIQNFTLSNFTTSANNLWQFDGFYDVSGNGVGSILAHPGQNLSAIDSTINTPVLIGDINGTTMLKIGVFTAAITGNNTNVVTLAAANTLVGVGQTMTGTNVPANTVVRGVNTTSVTVSNVVPSGTITATFDNNVDVSGGVVALHPYVFAYGNNGFIKNCTAGNPLNWVGLDANEVNVASGKIVQALPVRGGTNAPSGLFWSLDSLIRVSYLGGQGTPAQYWKYDIISSQSSILSSQSAIEYDGVYYWCGADRFLLYAGSVKEIPNNYNQNYFFDNLNYSQRQKVWACKVPRYGEIWWFYPRGDATECTDAVIYNVRENVWYDAGEALGARRSAGYFSLVFQYPIMADTTVTPSTQVFVKEYIATSGSVWLYSDTASTQVSALQVISGSTVATGTTVVTDVSNSIKTIGTITGGSGYTDGTYNATALSGGSGFGGTANIFVSGGAVTSVTIVSRGASYVAGGSLTATIPGGAGFSVLIATVYTQGIQMSAAATSSATAELTFSTPPNRIKIYQHEYGTNQVTNQSVSAIESYFETNDLGWVSGGPAAPSNPTGQGGSASDNRWIRLERVEPDFVQTGDMSLVVTGRPYAQSEDTESEPYVFSPTTGKIDMKEQRRELRLRFVSNTLNGNYQAGKILLDADIGDVRGY
jgi:hypothetical protein